MTATKEEEGLQNFQESALLKCEHCGNASRVWLGRCERCSSPTVSWYEQRIRLLEGLLKSQDKLIREQADVLNSYAAKIRKLEPKFKESGYIRMLRDWGMSVNQNCSVYSIEEIKVNLDEALEQGFISAWSQDENGVFNITTGHPLNYVDLKISL